MYVVYCCYCSQLQVLFKMSRNVKTVKMSAPVQKYCKVCHDAGKSEAEYRSHFTRETREPSSKVTCPTLLALECRYCYKNGHTVKYCPVLKDNEKQKKREEASTRRTEASQKAEVKPKGKSTNLNVFAILESDSEEEEIVQKPVKEEYPVLCAPALARSQSVSVNYAAALAKPAAPKATEVKVIVVAPPAPKPEAKPETKAAPWASSAPKASTMNWASWSDSEDEDEEESVVPSYTATSYANKPSVTADYDSDW